MSVDAFRVCYHSNTLNWSCTPSPLLYPLPSLSLMLLYSKCLTSVTRKLSYYFFSGVCGFYRCCTFSLTSLFISDIFNVISWVPNQKDLKSITMDIRGDRPDVDPASIYRHWTEHSPPESQLTLCHIRRCARSILSG